MNHTEKKNTSDILPSILLTLFVVSIALYFSYSWLNNKPKAHKHSPNGKVQNRTTLVEVISPKPLEVSVRIKSYGTVIPYRSQTLASRVSSQVITLSEDLIPGSIVKKGELLVALDPTDYELILKEREASVTNAKLTLQTELENQKSAQYDFSIFKQNVTPEQKEYLLRYPHIKAAKANLKAQEAAYEKAKSDLQRCKVYAPFDAVVLDVEVATGDMVSSSKTLATLAKAEAFWIKVALSPAKLKGIDIPNYNAKNGSNAVIRHDFWDQDTPSLAGEVQSIEKVLDENSKMAYLLIRVNDPLHLSSHKKHQKPLLLNGFVSIDIEGKKIHDVLKVPLSALHHNDTVWILQENHTLHIQKVTKIWQDEKYVYLPAKILKANESLITTLLETPIEGMPLRTQKKVDSKTPVSLKKEWHKRDKK